MYLKKIYFKCLNLIKINFANLVSNLIKTKKIFDCYDKLLKKSCFETTKTEKIKYL